MAGTKNHDYHILPPDIWPMVGALSALVMTSGLVLFMHKMPGGHIVLPLGIAGLIATFFSWFSNIVKEAREGHHTPVVQLHLRYGMILFIASEVMFFAAFFWMFFEMTLFTEARTAIPEVGNWMDTAAAWSTWPPKGVELLSPWGLPLLNTVILLLSGTTVTWAHHALQVGDRKAARTGLIITVLLGVLFTAVQVYEYQHILHENLFFNEEAANSGLYGSIFFMATGFHGFHVLLGTIFLLVCLLRLMAGQMTPQKHFGFEAAAWYWHFVDVVWLFLFAFVYVTFG